MSMEANKDLARAYFTAFRDRGEAWWNRFIAPDFVRHNPGLNFEVCGPTGVRELGAIAARRGEAPLFISRLRPLQMPLALVGLAALLACRLSG